MPGSVRIRPEQISAVTDSVQNSGDRTVRSLKERNLDTPNLTEQMFVHNIQFINNILLVFKQFALCVRQRLEKKSSFSTVMTKKVISFFSLTQIFHVLMFMLVMARYSHKGHDSIRYDITQNIAIRYDTIRSESASPYVRTASKQATAHNTGAPSFCLSTLSPLQVPGYWPTGEATVMGDRRGDRRRAGGWPVFLEVQGYSAGLL